MYKSLLVLILTMCSVVGMRAEKFVVCMSWTPHSNFAGYYVAQEKGFYKEAGIDVEIKHPLLTKSAYERMFTDGCDGAVFSLMTAISTIADGHPLVNVFQTSMNNSYVIVSGKGKKPESQKGDRIGVYQGETNYLAFILDRRLNMNWEYVYFAGGISAFQAMAFELAAISSCREVLQLKEAGYKIEENVNMFSFANGQYNIQEDGVYVRKEYYDTHRTQMQKFAAASRKGWDWAASHPEQALDIVMKYLRKNGERTNRTLQRQMFQEVLRLQTNRDTGKREYRLVPEMVRSANDLMKSYGMINRYVTYDELLGRKPKTAKPKSSGTPGKKK